VETFVVVSFVLMLLALGTVSALSLQSILRFREAMAWVDQSQERIGMFMELELDLREAEVALRTYLLTGASSQRDEYRRQAFDELGIHARELRRLAGDHSDQLARLDQIEPLLRQRVALMENVRRAYEADPKDRDGLGQLMQSGTAWSERATARLNDFGERERKILSTQLAMRTAESNSTMKAIWVGGVLGVVCAGLGLVIILRALRRRREVQERLRSSVTEQEILLSEVHHRVKNNLQVISSLLSLEGEKLKDPHDIAVFKECRDRIHGIARLHERVYTSGQFALVEFGDHLRELAGMLLQSHKPPGCEVSLEIHTDPLGLDLHTAVTLGLIANEVIINSLKHAFTGRTSGRLTIQLRDGAQPEMTVFDDGVGLPPQFDPKTSDGLGIELLNGMGRQIRGEVTLRNREEGGACTTVRFPLPETTHSTSMRARKS
jgi:two-component sensor histidine kinase/CHASE3 domain sensor protein